MAVEYDFINNFPAVLLNALANFMQYIAENSPEYMQLFLVFFLGAAFLGVCYYLLTNSFGSLKKQMERIQRVLA